MKCLLLNVAAVKKKNAIFLGGAWIDSKTDGFVPETKKIMICRSNNPELTILLSSFFVFPDFHSDRAPGGEGEAGHAAVAADGRAGELPEPDLQPDVQVGRPLHQRRPLFGRHNQIHAVSHQQLQAPLAGTYIRSSSRETQPKC